MAKHCKHCKEVIPWKLKVCQYCSFNGETCDNLDCQECCPHSEREHFTCSLCDKDLTDELSGQSDWLADSLNDK